MLVNTGIAGVGIAQWYNNRHVTERSWVQGMVGEFYSLGPTFCADSYFSIHSTPVTTVAYNRFRHSAKSASYICGFEW